MSTDSFPKAHSVACTIAAAVVASRSMMMIGILYKRFGDIGSFRISLFELFELIISFENRQQTRNRTRSRGLRNGI